jgi:hypothetical protein
MLNSLPFMPEMLKFAGKRYRVFKRVGKVCGDFEDKGYIYRRMESTVLLDGLRCEGEAHGGCQASCMLQWKEAWLKRVAPREPLTTAANVDGRSASVARKSQCTEESLWKTTRKSRRSEELDYEIFVCQLTESKNASCYLSPWDPRPFLRDIRSGNIGVWQCLRGMLIMLFNAVQRFRKGVTYPYFEPAGLNKTPGDRLDLRPGEVVEVKSKEEISQTLNRRNKNRGLWFDVEMLKFCGRRFPVRGHVRKMIDEHSGKMLNLPNDCVVLDGVICDGDYHEFCSRSEFIYWREVWLRRLG